MGILQEIDRIEKQYEELVQEWAALRADAMQLRFRYAQIQKQVDNIREAGGMNHLAKREQVRKKESMDNDLYYITLGYIPDAVKETGGQELILADIMACLDGCDSIFLPYECASLRQECKNQGMQVLDSMEGADAVYWGTPTIVDNKALFSHSCPGNSKPEEWTKDVERSISRRLRDDAEAAGVKRIVTGLGTGDISVAERMHDMGGGRMVSWKNFGHFEDWVILRILR